MNDNSEKRDPSYSLRDNDNFHFPSVNKALNDLDGISFLGPKTENLFLTDLKSIDDLEHFRKSI